MTDLDKSDVEALETGITNALHAGDIDAVEGLMGMLAVLDPDRAELLLETMKAGVRIRRVAAFREDPE